MIPSIAQKIIMFAEFFQKAQILGRHLDCIPLTPGTDKEINNSFLKPIFME